MKNIVITPFDGLKKAPGIVVDVTGIEPDKAYKYAVSEAKKKKWSYAF